MKVASKARKKLKVKTARLDPFTRGMVWGMHLAKMPRQEIKKLVLKKDGSTPELNAIDKIIAHKVAEPDWNGADSIAGGRPSALTDAQKKTLVKLVFKMRGRAVVTAPWCRKKLPFLRKVSARCVRRALGDAGLAWLSRRRKSWLSIPHKLARLAYCAWIKSRHQQTLDRFAYTDGTTWFLARGPADVDDKNRVALGKMVWRMSNGKDGLWDDNISPSLYAKSQGKPVKIWGFLANGRLEYHVLAQDHTQEKYKTTNMNGDRYNDLIEKEFAKWRKNCFRHNLDCHLVQDHEKCLWRSDNLTSLKDAGCPVVANYPKCSPDLNAIEGVWLMLKLLMLKTQPEAFEDRAEFLVRLRRQATWLNTNKRKELLKLCTNQKTRAAEVDFLEGAKCKW
jgi:hypothetical protein